MKKRGDMRYIWSNLKFERELVQDPPIKRKGGQICMGERKSRNDKDISPIRCGYLRLFDKAFVLRVYHLRVFKKKNYFRKFLKGSDVDLNIWNLKRVGRP